jgi:hypothetical protein
VRKQIEVMLNHKDNLTNSFVCLKNKRFSSHLYINKLIGATADVFIGYKKLINQFNNKPDKKTNVDW